MHKTSYYYMTVTFTEIFGTSQIVELCFSFKWLWGLHLPNDSPVVTNSIRNIGYFKVLCELIRLAHMMWKLQVNNLFCCCVNILKASHQTSRTCCISVRVSACSHANLCGMSGSQYINIITDCSKLPHISCIYLKRENFNVFLFLAA